MTSVKDLPLEAQVTLRQIQLVHNDQIEQWLNDAVAVRGAEFTAIKRVNWLQAQREPMTRLAVELGIQT